MLKTIITSLTGSVAAVFLYKRMKGTSPITSLKALLKPSAEKNSTTPGTVIDSAEGVTPGAVAIDTHPSIAVGETVNSFAPATTQNTLDPTIYLSSGSSSGGGSGGTKDPGMQDPGTGGISYSSKPVYQSQA